MASSYLAIVCNSAANSLGLYGLNQNGALAHLRDMKLPGVGAANGSYPMALGPDRKRLYVAFRGTPHEVLTYGIDLAGQALTLLGRAPLADSMAHIATDSSGRFLLSAAFGGGRLSVNPLDADGVALAPAHTIDAEPNMHCCIPLPDGTFLATSLGDDSILKFALDPAGTITRLPPRAEAASQSGPRHLVFHPSMRFAYLVTQMASTVDVFGFDGETLTPAPLQTLSILPPNWQGQSWAADIRITPDGRHLYASDRRASSIAAFAIDQETGRLTPLSHTFAAPWPRAINITPDGKFLLALGENTDLVEVFAIGTDGALDKRDALPTGRAPSWVEILV